MESNIKHCPNCNSTLSIDKIDGWHIYDCDTCDYHYDYQLRNFMTDDGFIGTIDDFENSTEDELAEMYTEVYAYMENKELINGLSNI